MSRREETVGTIREKKYARERKKGKENVEIAKKDKRSEKEIKK